MRGTFILTAFLAFVTASTAFAKSAPTTASVLTSPNATKRLTQQPAPLVTTQSVNATAVRRDRDAEIERIINSVEDRRRPSPVSP